MSTQAYPLHWPAGWPRTVSPSQSKFTKRTIHQSVEDLKRQLDLMNATNVMISSNVTLGAPPKDKGVCVYFNIKGKPYALPCDRWHTVEDNLRALTNHIEALRGQERWGVGSLERAFAGYTALPAASYENPSEWWTILKIARSSGIVAATDAYRALAKQYHPDNGGSEQAMALLNAAYAEAKKALQ